MLPYWNHEEILAEILLYLPLRFLRLPLPLQRAVFVASFDGFLALYSGELGCCDY